MSNKTTFSLYDIWNVWTGSFTKCRYFVVMQETCKTISGLDVVACSAMPPFFRSCSEIPKLKTPPRDGLIQRMKPKSITAANGQHLLYIHISIHVDLVLLINIQLLPGISSICLYSSVKYYKQCICNKSILHWPDIVLNLPCFLVISSAPRVSLLLSIFSLIFDNIHHTKWVGETTLH